MLIGNWNLGVFKKLYLEDKIDADVVSFLTFIRPDDRNIPQEDLMIGRQALIKDFCRRAFELGGPETHWKIGYFGELRIPINFGSMSERLKFSSY